MKINDLLTFLLEIVKIYETLSKADVAQNSASYVADFAFHTICVIM